MAEKEGFEPSIPFWGIHDFQSCALGQLRDFSMSCRPLADLHIIHDSPGFVKYFFPDFKPKLCTKLSYTFRYRYLQHFINLPLSFGGGIQEPGVVAAWVVDGFHFVQFQQNVMDGQTICLQICF